MKKSEWFDSSLTIIGLVLSIIATFNLTGLIKSKIDVTQVLSFVSLFLGIAIVVIIVYKNKTDTKVFNIPQGKFFDFIAEEINGFDNNSKAILLNPSKSFSQLEPTFNLLSDKSFKISLVGASDTFLNILSSLSVEKFTSIKNFSYVTNFGQNIFTIVLLDDSSKKMSVLLSSGPNGFLFRLKKKPLITAIRDTILRVDTINDYGINLNHTSNPEKLLELINSERTKYISNFTSLKSGHISFYGTEVLAVQAGWLHTGKFKMIRTLDITSDPGLLLTRYKYIEANKNFIKSGGVIQRVYLIEKERLTDELFKSNLKANIELQREIGVTLGLYLMDDLNPHQKQDFILYDNYSVFVEEKQANSDYSFGKSTAYFNREKVEDYERLFNSVWDDGRKSAIQILNEVVKSI